MRPDGEAQKHLQFKTPTTGRDWILAALRKGSVGLSFNPSRGSLAGSPDSRYIRVETCMFMIKLPQYSSLDIMLEKLRYAIHYREDPLSG